MAFLRNSMWWAGMGAFANFGAYTFAPPIMVTPLGALRVIAIFASFLLNERLGHLWRVGCGLCILGSSIIVLHAPEDQDLETVTQFLEYAIEPGASSSATSPSASSHSSWPTASPRGTGAPTPLVYISIALLVGGVSVMFVKGFSVTLKLAFAGENQFVYPSMYLFLGIAAVCIVVQLNYANKALDLFSVNLYAGCCTATIVASLILFKGFNTTSPSNTVSLLCAFIVTFLGVHVLNLAMVSESEPRAESQVSLGDSAGRGSLNSVRTPLFGAFVIEASEPGSVWVGGESVRLHRLLEEGEEEFDDGGFEGENAGETTSMYASWGGVSSRGSRSPHNMRISPRPV
ncbi:DUF803-domain-containing protein [Mycena vulgaris]|nr:DUF803-domain-containing protein [Mycena vulgaris]